MSSRSWRVLGVIVLFIIFSFLLAACDIFSTSDLEQYSHYNILIEVIDTDTKEGLQDVTLTLEDYDAETQTAEPEKQIGLYAFKEVKLEKNEGFTVYIEKEGYLDVESSLVADQDPVSATGDDAVQLEERKPNNIKITYGNELIYLPKEKGTVEEYEYKADVYDQQNKVMEQEEEYWKLEDDPIYGVSLDEEQGILTISWDAETGELILIATSESDPALQDPLPIEIDYLSEQEEGIYEDAFANLDGEVEKLGLDELEEEVELPATIEGYDAEQDTYKKFDIIWTAEEHPAVEMKDNIAQPEQGYEDIVGYLSVFIQPQNINLQLQTEGDPRQRHYEAIVPKGKEGDIETIQSFDLSEGSNSLTLPNYDEEDYAAVILFPRDDAAYVHEVGSLTTTQTQDAKHSAFSPTPLQDKVALQALRPKKLCGTPSPIIQEKEREALRKHESASNTARTLHIASSPEIGDTEEFHIIVEEEKREATLRGKNEKALLWVTEESEGYVSDEDVDYYLEGFADYYHVLKEYFGREPDANEFEVLEGTDSRVNIVFSSFDYGGYFNPGDLFSADEFDSNERKVIYINSEMSLDYTAGTIAHEFQHMLFFNEKFLAERIADDLWINEGFSELAQDVSGYGYEQGVGLFKANAFLVEPWVTPLISWEEQTRDYGASYLYARYIYDRFGQGMLDEVSTSSQRPKYAIENYSGSAFYNTFEDWAITLLAEVFNLEVAPEHNYSTITIPELYGVVIDPGDGWQDGSVVGWGISYTLINSGAGDDLLLEVEEASTAGNFWKTVVRWRDN